MAFNVPEEEKPKFNKAVKSGLDLFAKDVQRTLGQLEVLQPQTLVEAYNQPVQSPIARDLTPLEQYVYEPQPVPEVGSLTEIPARDSMVVSQEQPQVLSNFRNQAEAQFDRDMVSITPYEQAITDVVGAEVDSLRNDAGEIAKSPLEVFSKPLNANSVRALGLVDQDGNPTERGQLFYNLQQSGMFNEDGTINEKGQAYLTSIEDMKNPEWFQQPGSKEKFDILWEDGVIRSSSTPGEILSNVTKFAGDAVYGGAELAQQQAMGLAYNSRTWGGLLGMEDSRPDYLKARGEATELSIAENMYKNVIQTSNLIDVGLASDRQFIDESIMSPLYGALEKITGIQRPQPQEIDQANANIKNSKDALVAARYNQWATDQRLADMEAGEIGETILGIDNAVQKAEAAKQELGNEEFNKVYGRVGAFTNIAGDPTNVIPAAFAVKASKAVPLASRAMLNAQKTMGNIAAMDLAIAQGNTAVQASRAALAKVEPTVNLAQRMAANFAEGAKTQPALLERSAKASQIASRVTAEANQIRSTLPTITAELDSLITKRNSLATRIPEAYSQKVLQTMELGRQMRAMPAKAVGATLERVGDTISKTDTAVTNFLQERGLDQMYTAAVGAAGVVGLAGNPIIGAIGAGAAALKTGNVLSNYGKLFRYVGKEMENVRGQIPFWKRVAAHTAPGSLGRGFAHTFNMLDLGGVTSDTIRRAGRGIAAAAPTDLMFEYLSDGADMRPETLWQAGAESFVIGGSFAAGGGAFMGTKKRMRELSIGDELNFRRNLTDTRQKALFEAIPAGTRRAISTYAIANPTLNYTFKDSGASRYDPNTNTAVINVNSTNPIKALVAHETLHHTVIKNNMEPGIAALFLGDTKNNTVGGLFRSRDGKLDPNFEAFRDGYYKRLGVEGMSNAERDAIYPLDKIAVEYFIEKHADQYAAMAESGELGAVASSGAARRKLGSILETVLPRIPVLKDLHFKSGGMIDKNGAWVTGNGILDAEGVKRDPITSKMFRDMNRRSAGLVPGQFDPLMSDKPDSGAPILLNPSDSIDAELLHPLVQVDDANKPIMKDGKPVALDRATELSRALAGLTAVEVMRRKRAENYAPEKGEAHVDDEGQFQPGWLSNDVLTEMFAKNKYNPEQKRIIREMNKLIRKGAGDRVVMINFPATTRNKAGKVVYKPQGATLRDTVPVAVTISKDGNLLFGLMSVTKLHENIQKRSQDRRGKKLYGGNVDLILRDTQAMMDYHKQGLDSIEFFKQKYGAVEADERKKFINTMFGLLNQKEQAVLNPMLLEDGIKSKDNVYRTYRADRVSKAVPMAPDEYAAMPFSYEAVSQVRMPEQRQMPEAQKSVASSENQVQEGKVNERQPTTIQTQSSGTSVGGPETTGEGLRQQGGLPRGTEQLQPQGRPGDQGIPLTGLPATVTVPGIGKYTFGPNETARNIAAEYARSAGIDYNPPSAYAKVDTERAKRIADEYEKMVHNPNDPKVKESYDAMIKETLDQWEAIKRTGLKVEPIPAGSPDPYAASPRLAIIDVKDNNHLWFFPTESGFGGTESAQVDISGNPLMQPTGEVLNGHVMLANDVFRIVHDYFGHIKEGVGFRADGEENAWRSHSAMYSDKARPAMTAETRGQNSWVNFGPFAEFNKTAKGAETQYAPQKTGLLPDWVMREGASDKRLMPEKIDADYMKAVEGGDVKAQQRIVDEVAKKAGYVTGKAFHSTKNPRQITQFITTARDALGAHFGLTRRQAVGPLGRHRKVGKGVSLYEVYLNATNPIRLEDRGTWSSDRVVPQINEQLKSSLPNTASRSEIVSLLRENGYDSAIYENRFEGKEGDQAIIVFDPSQIKSADPITRDDSGNIIPPSKRFDITSKDLRFMPEKDSGAVDLMSQTSLNGDPFMIMSAKWGTPKQTSQTVSQSSKPENHIVGLSRIKGLMSAKDLTPKQKASLDDFLVKTASFATDSPGFRDLGTPQTKEEALTVIAKVVDRMARNLLAIYDAVPPPIRSYWQRWYPLAYNWNQEQAKNYSITRQVVAGINARLSPGKDWIHNVNMTERILKAFSDDVVMTKEIEDGAMPIIDSALETKLNTRENKNKPKEWVAEQKEKAKAAKLGLQKMIGLKLSQMTDAQAAQLIRYYTQVVGDNRVLNYFEQGTPVYADSISWQSFSNLEKAINMYRNPSMKNISENMGSDHKIRSFFNNQESPNDPVLRDVTSDTHAVAAAYLLPLSQSSQQVSRNFGGASNAVSGLNGMYYIVADAYRKAADARGVEPRAMQSITWEGARSMFPRGFKKAENVKKVESIWNRFERKEITKSQALQEINQLLIDFFAKNPNSRPRFAVLPRQ